MTPPAAAALDRAATGPGPCASEGPALAAMAALEAAGRIEEALAALGDTRPEAMAPAAALLAGRCLMRRPDPMAALAFLHRATAPEVPAPVAIEAHRALGGLRFGLGQDLLAAGHFRAILALDPGNREARFQLGRAFEQLGWHVLALREFGRLAPPLPGWWMKIVLAARREGDAVRRHARRVLARPRRHDGTRRLPRGAALAMLAQALMRAGRLRAAEGLLALGLARTGREAMLHLVAQELRLYRAEAVAGDVPLPTPRLGEPTTRLAAARMAQQLDAPDPAFAALRGLDVPGLGAAATRLRAQVLIRRGDIARLAAAAKAEMAAAPLDQWPARHALTAAVLAREVPVWHGAASVPPAPARLPLLQFWHDREPPADVRAVMQSWPRLNPALEPARFDGATARTFLAAEGGSDLVALFDACHHPAMQADLFRLVFLHRHGGLYVDADERCRRPVPDLIGRVRNLAIAAPCSDELPYYVNNAILLAEAGSPVLALALVEARRGIAASLAAGRRPSIWNHTGPGALTRAIARHAAAGGGGEVALIELRYLRSFSETVDDLAYKFAPGGDWRQV